MNHFRQLIICGALITGATAINAQTFKLNDRGYFNAEVVDVMAFDDIYPEGHQAGVSIRNSM